jgi:hypothetical protein
LKAKKVHCPRSMDNMEFDRIMTLFKQSPGSRFDYNTLIIVKHAVLQTRVVDEGHLSCVYMNSQGRACTYTMYIVYVYDL